MSKNYMGVEDLLCDETFLSWYFKTDVRAVKHWQQWIADNPGSRERIQQAVAFLDSLRLEEKSFSPEQITLAESQLLQQIRKAQPAAEPSHTKAAIKIVGLSYKRSWLVAASILVLAIMTGSILLLSRQHELKTAYGEIREQLLPDGTEVTANANTKLVYSSHWKDGHDREVWLTGEAFFHVSKTPMKSRFIVHTDHFDIIVTGTKFNVVNRQDKANVMLKEGSVILHTTEGNDLKMKPGDFVEYRSAELEKRPVKNDSVLAWKEHKLVFDNTPLREVARIIHEHYGVTVQLADESLGDRKVFGIMANDNLDILLQALGATGDFDVVRDGDMITIRDRR